MQLLKTTVVTGALLLSLVQLGAAELETSASCKGQVNCATCVSAHPYCAWCKTERSPEFRNNHCDILAAVQSFCPPGDIVFPQANITVVTNTSLSEQQSPSQPIQPIQVAPQHLRLRLKPHDPVKFEVKFRQVADYPLDLYYLMDLTDTMREDKALLESLGEEMAMTLRGLTKNFRLGFGSFVDKPVMPYVSQVPDNKKNPCSLYGACVPAYGFRHHLNLSNHVYQFTEKMRAVQVSGNIDNLEGGLDALVQVATCADVIGWNQKSRKLIIYTSDGQFHLAGEGLLGGAVERNELRCQLDDNGYYTQTTTHDYPSVAELDRVLRTENMNVVFAVTGQYKIQYDRLVKIMKSNVQVASLLDDSSNILSVIEEQYKRITSRIELVDDSGDNITVRYRSHCNATELQERNICTDLRTGDLVSFEVEVEATGCPKQKNHTIHLKDVLTSETVRLDVEILCACDCDQAEEVNSDKCSGVGTLRCGVCNCPDNRAGWNCECTGDLGGQTCRPDNSSSSGPECSGRGDCVCGKCECDSDTTNDPAHVIGGQYCECDSLQCDRAPDGSICGGELHGHCECDQCVCRPGWTGDDCTCTNDTRNCAPANTNSGLLCYGKGDCNCGRCHCYNTERGRYAGQFCEDCPTCRGLCRTYQPCAQCSLRSGAAAALNCSSCDESYVIALQDQLAAAEKGTVCRFQDAVDGCFYQFQYYSDENGRNIINVLKSKECYEVDVLAIVLGTVGAVVAVGLATLLLWRLFTYVSDRHEYARFEQEQKGAMAAASTNNELYHSPITKYTVPDDVKLFGEDD